MRPSKLLMIVAPLVVSWLCAACFRQVVRAANVDLHTHGPWVPYLPAYTSEPGSSDVRSSVYYLFVVLAAALLAALPIELSKLASRSAMRPIITYVLLALQQCLLIADVVRSYAADWWLYVLSIVGLRPITSHSWMEAHFTLVGNWPWPTAVTAFLIGGIIVYWNREAGGGAIRRPTQSV